MSYIKVSSSAVNAALTATTTAFFAFSSTFYAASVVNLAVFKAASTVVNATSVAPQAAMYANYKDSLAESAAFYIYSNANYEMAFAYLAYE